MQDISPNNWPVQQALKIKDVFPNQEDTYIFETGYGPSGLPHIGTFAEVVRTNMVMQTFHKLTQKKTQLIAFSDDMDGLRKVPSNVPHADLLEQDIKKPIFKVRDPFGCHESFADHNISLFIDFLNTIPELSYTSLRASVLYTNGTFDETLLLFLRHYDAVMDVILPTLREERRKTYSIFLPISLINGTVLEVPIKHRDVEKGTIVYEDVDGKDYETPVTGGHCKLQWKADFAMRWYHLGVNYEMCGKDVRPSFDLSVDVLRVLGRKAPVNLTYELFLDDQGHKISKSKGNEEITVDSWTKYAPMESLTYFMYGNPQRAKKLSFSVIPNSTDRYLQDLYALNECKNDPEAHTEALWNHPDYYVHNLHVPPTPYLSFDYSLLLNLASVSNASSEDILWSFLQKYDPSVHQGADEFADLLVAKATRYYKDFIEPHKEFVSPTDVDRTFLIRLRDALRDDFTISQVEELLYDIGKEYVAQLQQIQESEIQESEIQESEQSRELSESKDSKNSKKSKISLGTWFSMLYQTLLGQKTGPRMGSFIVIYGLDATKQRITSIIE